KARGTYQGARGRLILEDHKAEVIMLIEEAHENGARYSKACVVVGISHRTLQRWKQGCLKDRRKGLELQGKNEHFKKPKTSIGNNCVSILLERDIPRSNASVSGYKRRGYTQTGASVALPCYGSFCRKSIRTSGS
ncbi:helix-turn-helix domain-containing protein, partial [Chlorobium phaeovibrioides]